MVFIFLVWPFMNGHHLNDLIKKNILQYRVQNSNIDYSQYLDFAFIFLLNVEVYLPANTYSTQFFLLFVCF